MKKIFLNMFFISAFASADITPDSVKLQVEKHGTDTLQSHINESTWYNVIVTKVAEGDAEWIAIIPLLRDIPVDKRQAALVIAAQRGLIHNPKAMLKVLNSIDDMTPQGKVEYFETENICYGIFPGMSKRSYQLLYAATKHALSDVGTAADKCLWALNSVHDELMVEDKNGMMTWGINSIPGY